MREYGFKFFCSLGIIIAAIILGGISLSIVYSIPTETMKNNISSSIERYEQERDYPTWAANKATTQGDNFTDSIILRNVIFQNEESSVITAMLGPRMDYQQKTQVDNLVLAIIDSPNGKIINYPQYWHGYLVLLKPLLAIIPLSYFLLMNYLFQFLGMAYLLILLAEKYGKGYSMSLFLAYLLLNPVTVAMSLQFSTMLNLTILVSILLIKQFDFFIRDLNYLYFFVITGIMTSFFDFLTYPAVSLGIPLIILLVALNKKQIIIHVKEIIQIISSSSLFGGLGYSFMFLGKWLLGSVITGVNIYQIATNQVAHRMSYNGTDVANSVVNINPIRAISRNLQVLAHEPILPILLIFLGISIYFLFKRKKLFKNSKIFNFTPLKKGLAIIALYPFLWYIVITNHSFIHSFFTYRELTIFVFALGCLLTTTFEEYDIKDKG